MIDSTRDFCNRTTRHRRTGTRYSCNTHQRVYIKLVIFISYPLHHASSSRSTLLYDHHARTQHLIDYSSPQRYEYQRSLWYTLYSHHTSRIYFCYLVNYLSRTYLTDFCYFDQKNYSSWQSDDLVYHISISKRTTNRRTTLPKPSSRDDYHLSTTRQSYHHRSYLSSKFIVYRLLSTSQRKYFTLFRTSTDRYSAYDDDLCTIPTRSPHRIWSTSRYGSYHLSRMCQSSHHL